MSDLLLCHAGICLSINWAAFLVAAILQTDAFYDVTGSFTTLSVMLMCWRYHERSLASQDTSSTYQHFPKLPIILSCFWTLRLGGFLAYRIYLLGHDSRMDRIKTKPASFFVAWTAQAIWVFSITLPIQVLMYADSVTGFTTFEYAVAGLGLASWVTGMYVEASADWQKLHFRLQPQNKGRFVDIGLFRYARYPAYFGETLLWAGTALLCGSKLRDPVSLAAAVASPAVTYLLLRYGSGVPIQEKQAQKRWGSDKAYLAYRARTRLLLPLPSVLSKDKAAD